VSFYAAFEALHRGSREDIKSRLWVYGPYLGDIKAVRAEPTALDLGCGRGEWLEILREVGIEGRGVDLDRDMVATCESLGLPASHGDALAALRAAPDASLDLVTAFHLVEHLPFDLIESLAAEALRALRPGGLLVMETPNPENLEVGASRFYLDPTHLRPLPPALLAFVPKHLGFHRTRLMRLQENPRIGGNAFPSVGDLLTEVSPDYAVVAQKDGPAETLQRFDVSFERHYGVSLADLIERHDYQRALRDALLETRAEAAESVEARLTAAEAVAQEALALATHARDSLHAMRESASWKVTAPLRWTAATLKRWLGR
jgi:SAM-dependent methyltransferase